MTQKRAHDDSASDANGNKKPRRHVVPELPDSSQLIAPIPPAPVPLVIAKVTPLGSIERLVNGFVVIGKIINKAPIRQVIINMEKQPMLLFDIQDESGIIHCYAYNTLAVRLNTELEVNTTIKMAKFLLRPVNKCFSASANTYEFLVNQDTQIEKLDVELTLPHTPTPYSTFADIYCMEDKTVINTRGTIKKINAPVEKKSSSGTILTLTTIVMRDGNNTTMILNLWNERGTDFPFHVDDDLLIKNCKVSIYAGTPSISAFASTEFSHFNAVPL